MSFPGGARKRVNLSGSKVELGTSVSFALGGRRPVAAWETPPVSVHGTNNLTPVYR